MARSLQSKAKLFTIWPECDLIASGQFLSRRFSMSRPNKIPARSGIGLKGEHYKSILDTKPDLGFFEIHAENYMGDGGLPHALLTTIRETYPLSLHGVGLSIGGAKLLDREHLSRLKALNDRYEPGLFSEHLAWSTHDVGYLSDLLPLPYTTETLARVCAHIDETQSYVGRQMLLENPSSYLTFVESTMNEAEFISEIVKRTGCGLLLDINNVYISAHNICISAEDYLAAYPLKHVQEIHLAGHTETKDDAGVSVIIDDHASPIVTGVWDLFAYTINQTGPLPVLIERDDNVPELEELVGEAHFADGIMKRHFVGAA
jgi:uncharacterized protein